MISIDFDYVGGSGPVRLITYQTINMQKMGFSKTYDPKSSIERCLMDFKEKSKMAFEKFAKKELVEGIRKYV